MRSFLRTLPIHVVLWLAAVFVVIPFLYGLLGGFKDTRQLSTNPIGLPDPWVVENYTGAITSASFWQQLFNSTMIALATAVLVVALSALAAFGFARFAFRGREFLFTLFGAGLMFPFAVAVLPLFVLLRTFGLLDNPLGVILPQVAFGLPLTIVILRTFFHGVPREIEESARMDGCSPFGFFWKVLLPISRPVLATVSVLAIVSSWNNFFLPLVVLNDQSLFTLPLGVHQFQGEFSADTARILAYVMVSMVPAMAFYAIAERQLISGLTAGAVKN